ncbi:hypothetical protein TNIN_259321 [Trichonephila inaurata madagascariensis]|uniref:Uncharacterized protein n=1 Tax=Trichonephila inaurata madagascariensis TaxID=2747483 RepID=A0A8X6XKK5_9ARAC|nr:hypothetical protein TNIN_259321 [Trichonephila inaurata madagascariensis]
MAPPDQPLDLSRHRPSNDEVYRPVGPEYRPPSDSESEDLPNLYSPEPETEDRPPLTQRRPVPYLVAPKWKWHPKRPSPFPKKERQEPSPSPRNPAVPPNSPVPRNQPVPPNSPVSRNSPVPRNSSQPQNTPGALRISTPMVLRPDFPSINMIKTYYDSNFVQHIPQPNYNMGFPRYITFRLGNRKVLYSASHQYSLTL